MSKSADAFRTISEVAEWLGVQTHVLRFWESKFTQIRPIKRAGGRRYYRPTDMLLLGGIRKLLYDDGLTIKGVQKVLREEGTAHVADMSPPLDAQTDEQLEEDLASPMAEDVPQDPVVADIVPFVSPTGGTTPEKPVVNTPPQTDTDASLVSSEQHPTAPLEQRPIPEYEDSLPLFDQANLAPAADASDQGAGAQGTSDQDALAERQPETDGPIQATDPIPQPEEDVDAATVSASLPSFLRPPSSEPAIDIESPLVETADETANVDTSAMATAPRIVDVPDTIDAENIPVAPSLLTKAFRLSRLTDGQRNVIRPLIAQLTALRDQMAGGRTTRL